MMLDCWSHLPKDRPTFDVLLRKLWESKSKGSGQSGNVYSEIQFH